MKAWNFTGDEKAVELLKEYTSLGMSWGCAQQVDTPRQKEIILELIDLCDDPRGIYLDWDDEYVSKDRAKEYIRNYGTEKE